MCLQMSLQATEAKAAKKIAAKAQIYNLNFQPKFIIQIYNPNLHSKFTSEGRRIKSSSSYIKSSLVLF